MDLSELYLPAQEVASFLRPVMERLRMSKLGVDSSARLPAGSCGRVLRSQGVVGSRVAERLLEAVGVDLWQLPTWAVVEEFSEAVRAKHRKQLARNARCSIGAYRDQGTMLAAAGARAAHQRERAAIDRMWKVMADEKAAEAWDAQELSCK